MSDADEPKIGIVNCPLCLTPMVDIGDDLEAADARLVCPECGYTAIAI